MLKEEFKDLLLKYNAKVKTYKKGTITSYEHDKFSSLQIILKGSINREFMDENTNLITTYKLKEGDSFGGMSLFTNNHIEGFHILTILRDTTVLEIEKEDLLNLCQDNRNFLLYLLDLISIKIIDLHYRIEVTSYKSVRKKIIYFLKKSYLKSNSSTIVLDKSKKEIAILLGIQRTSLSRELNKMKGENIIDYNRNEITLLDLNTIISH